MGARQSKRVEISSASKKGDVENGAIVGTEEKLEKIEEGETVACSKSNANGSTTTSSTVTAEQQETATSATEVAAVPETSLSKESESKGETITEVAATEKSTSEEVISPGAADDSTQEVKSPASPSETTTTTEEGASTAEKKKKPKKRWSFRSFSFSKKDKSKPVAAKDEQKQQETLPEGNEAGSQTEQQKNEDAEKKTKEEEEKKKDDLVPPPLPTSPPPTPAEEIAVVATSIVNDVPAVVPEKEDSLNVLDGDAEASGGGEGLAEPLEDGELLDESITPNVAAVEPIAVLNGNSSLTNGTNGVVETNGKVSENEDLASPACELKTSIAAAVVDSVTAKIDSIKLHIASDNAETPAQNGFGDHSLNGDVNDTSVNGDSGSHFVSDSVVDTVQVSADADN